MTQEPTPTGAGWRRVVTLLGYLALTGVGVTVFARLTGLEPGPVAVLVAVMPWVSMVAAALLVLAVSLRARMLMVGSAVATALCLVWIAPLYIAAPAAEQEVLTVATLNMTVGEADAAAVVRLVEDSSVDILSLQELTPAAVERLRAAGLDSVMPHCAVFAQAGFGGAGLWSRTEVLDSGTFDGFVFEQAWADVVTALGPVRVLAVHPAAPGPLAHDKWDRELAHLREVLAEQSGPVLVAGDFNTTRDHRAFRAIEGLGYADAATQAGAGFLPTYPDHSRVWPLVAIDHVMIRDVPAVAVEVSPLSVPGADHRALVVRYHATP
jgi:endonuclease/exonuclease/phosphatase (EEP) superfamily protein YafD